MFNILYVTDNSGLVRYWVAGGPFVVNGSTVPVHTAAVTISDIIYDRLSKGGYASDMIFENFHLLKARVTDIPDSVDDIESLKSWYFEAAGEVLDGVTDNPHVAWHSDPH